MNIALLTFIAVTSILYIGYIVLKYGVLRSISASYHSLETPVKKSLYSWFIFCIALPMMILSNNTLGWWAGALLMLDFAAPSGGDPIRRFLHYLGAQGGIGLGIAMLGFSFHQWWLVGLSVGTILVIHLVNKFIKKVVFEFKNKEYEWQPKNATWWIEVAALVYVWVGLLLEN